MSFIYSGYFKGKPSTKERGQRIFLVGKLSFKRIA